MYTLGEKHKLIAKYYRPFAVMLVIGLIVIVGIVIATKTKDQYKIPKAVKDQLSFPVLFLANPAPPYKLDTPSIKYSSQPDGSKVFSFATYSSNNRVTFSEQAYPEALVYDKFTNSLNPYSEVGTSYGQVTLGMPKDAAGRQVAGFKYGDATLIFAQPTRNISDADWRNAINSLSVVE